MAFFKGTRKSQTRASNPKSPKIKDFREGLENLSNPIFPPSTGPSATQSPPSPVKSRLGTGRKFRILVITFFTLICLGSVSFALTWRFDDNSVYSQEVGEAAKDDIVAPKALTYVSQVQSTKAQNEAANNPLNTIYRRDDSVVNKQRANLNVLLAAISSARFNAVSNASTPFSLLNEEPFRGSGLTAEQISRLLTMPDSQWKAISNEAKTTFNLVTAVDLTPDNVSRELNRLKNDLYSPWNLSPNFVKLDEISQSLVLSLVQPFMEVNSFIDNSATKVKKEEASKKADPVTVSIVKGQSIVRRGEILTELQVEQLQQLGLRSAGNNLQNVLGTVGIIIALILLMVYYFTLLHRTIWGNYRMLLFIGMSLIIAATGMRLLVSNYSEHNLRPYFLPLAAISMVLAALLNVDLALFLTAVLALLAGYVAQSPEVAVVYFVGGAAGAFTLFKAERTLTFVYAGLAVAAGQFGVALFLNLALHSPDLSQVGLLLVTNLGNGLVSTSLAFFVFSAMGKLFGVTTVIQLLELAHPNQPLLRRLMREAPGTYHHSILVSNLAEQAAERLMGDALLARVGAYYHDIGKLTRPSYFIDNQGGNGNIHDTLDPRESARLIKSHVSDGVALAKKNHLPRKVVDIIHQHHGTCLVAYFYSKALELGLDVSELDFRYPGPKPQTKVAAIVMLSDGVEAAVRANVQSGRIATGQKTAVPASQTSGVGSHARPVTIEAVVNKIIDDRIRDQQLNECDLTLKDINELRGLFVEILAGIYHPRIDYPDAQKKAVINPPPGKPEEVEAIVVSVKEDAAAHKLAMISPFSIDLTRIVEMGPSNPNPNPTLNLKNLRGEEIPSPSTLIGSPNTSGSLKLIGKGNKGSIGSAGRLISSGRNSDQSSENLSAQDEAFSSN